MYIYMHKFMNYKIVVYWLVSANCISYFRDSNNLCQEIYFYATDLKKNMFIS